MSWDFSDESNFSPETFGGKDYSPFFYSNHFYYNGSDDADHNYKYNNHNVKEWCNYFDKTSVPEKFINYILNSAEIQEIKSLTLYFIENKKLQAVPDSIKIPYVWISNNKNKMEDFLKYAFLAKQSEVFALYNPNQWYENEEEAKTLFPEEQLNGLSSKIEEKFKHYQNQKNSFIAQRYLFQWIRYLFFYNPGKAYEVYNLYADMFAKNEMYYRILGYVAGSLKKSGDTSLANYHYSLVFSGSEIQRISAHHSFAPQNEPDWIQTLAFAKSADEKATLWQMLGIYYGDEFRSMKEIYALDPSSPRLHVLLTRLVNIYEKNLNSISMENPDFMASNQEAIQWVREKALEGKISNPFLWNVSAGYLAFLNNDFSGANLFYQKAELFKPSSLLADQQMRIFSLLNQVGSLSGITEENERNLLPGLKWLFELNTNTIAKNLRHNNAVDWIKKRLSEIYKNQGNYIKAECFLHDVNFYEDDIKTEEILAFFNDPSRTVFDVFCEQISFANKTDIMRMKAIKAAFENDIEVAISLMEKSNFRDTLPADPFKNGIRDCHDCDHAKPKKPPISSLNFLRKIKELQTKIANKTDVFQSAILLGNAFYNISFYGNNRAFYYSKLIDNGSALPESIPDICLAMIMGNSVSKSYFTMALSNAPGNEEKARCYYFIAKCERNEWYNKRYYLNPEFSYNSYESENEDKIDFIDWPAFRELRKMGNTNYYREVIRECGYFVSTIRK